MRQASVGDLAAALRETGLVLLSDPAGAALAARRVVLLEPRSGVPSAPGGVLLLAGVAADDPAAAEVLAQAAAAGCAAAVVRLDRDPPAGLPAAADAHGLALLGVDPEVEWLHLATMLTGVLDSVARQLPGRQPAVGDLFGLANAVAAAVGGATAIEDFARRVLAYSTVPDQATDEDRREGILGRQVPDLPENEEQYRELYRSPGVVRFPATAPALPRLAIAVRAGAEPVGSIWVVDPGGGFGPEAEPPLVAAAEMAALHLLRARSAEDVARHQRGELVRGLLDGRLDPAATLARLDLPTSGPFTVLALEPRAAGRQVAAGTRLLDLVALQLEPRLGASAAGVSGSTVHVLVSGPRAEATRRLVALCGRVREAAAGSLRLDLLAAVGPATAGPGGIEAVRHEADRALALLRADPALPPVAAVADLSDRLAVARLSRLVGDDPGLASTRGRRLLAHDREHGTAYAAVALAWLDSLRDVGATARTLGVHPNTVRYRLRRAAELFDLDLADPDQLLVLWWTLRAG